jgi:hypothetical protein
VNAPELDAYLETLAAQAAASVIGVHESVPVTRAQWQGGEQLPELDADTILEHRQAMLAGIEKSGATALMPDTAYLLGGDGTAQPVEVDDLDEAGLLAAQVLEAACAMVLVRALNQSAKRMAGLERLRLARAELDAGGGLPWA